jgi:hypothetical protein
MSSATSSTAPFATCYLHHAMTRLVTKKTTQSQHLSWYEQSQFVTWCQAWNELQALLYLTVLSAVGAAGDGGAWEGAVCAVEQWQVSAAPQRP